MWIVTPVAVLRPHRADDTGRTLEAFADVETLRWFPDLPDRSTAEDVDRSRDQTLAAQAEGQLLCWAVADPADDRLLGEVTLFGLDGGRSTSADIGYWIHPDARRRGIATAAVRAAARHALLPASEGGLGLRRVALRAVTGNVASLRVATAAGFTRTGTDRRAERLRDGTHQDLACLDLLAEEVSAPS